MVVFRAVATLPDGVTVVQSIFPPAGTPVMRGATVRLTVSCCRHATTRVARKPSLLPSLLGYGASTANAWASSSHRRLVVTLGGLRAGGAPQLLDNYLVGRQSPAAGRVLTGRQPLRLSVRQGTPGPCLPPLYAIPVIHDALAEVSAGVKRAVEKLRTGSMPPAGLPRPKQADVDAVIKWMVAAVVRADDQTKPNPGRVTAHRLNRAEYNNTVRDLLGVDIRPADEFPQDDSGYGFDNIGDVLSMSPVLMERYLTAADKLVRAALYGPEKLKPVMNRPPVLPRTVTVSPAAYALVAGGVPPVLPLPS